MPPSSIGPKPGMPQATVQMQKKPAPATPSKSAVPGSITVSPTTPLPAATEEVSPLVGGLALAASLVALAIQIWMII